MRVHLIEVAGEGGIYQHTLAVAALLRREGVPVTLHTSQHREIEPPPGVEVCDCFKWFRHLPRGPVRRVLIGLSYTFWSSPHLLRRVHRGEVAHYQGHLLRPITATLLWLLRLRGARVVHSPHNTFNRVHLPLDDFALRMCTRAAARSIVFSDFDERRVTATGGTPIRSPLVQLLPHVAPADRARWRERWGANGKPIALFAGQLREDKCLADLLAAAPATSGPVKVAVVGDDKGEADGGRALAERLGLDVSWNVGYFPLDDFVAAIAAADVVVCPYRQASQSGVLSIARQLGVRTVAADVGGLAELADAVFPHGDLDALAAAIDAVLADPESELAQDFERAARDAHLAAYALMPEH